MYLGRPSPWPQSSPTYLHARQSRRNHAYPLNTLIGTGFVEGEQQADKFARYSRGAERRRQGGGGGGRRCLLGEDAVSHENVHERIEGARIVSCGAQNITGRQRQHDTAITTTPWGTTTVIYALCTHRHPPAACRLQSGWRLANRGVTSTTCDGRSACSSRFRHSRLAGKFSISPSPPGATRTMAHLGRGSSIFSQRSHGYELGSNARCREHG